MCIDHFQIKVQGPKRGNILDACIHTLYRSCVTCKDSNLAGIASPRKPETWGRQIECESVLEKSMQRYHSHLHVKVYTCM